MIIYIHYAFYIMLSMSKNMMANVHLLKTYGDLYLRRSQEEIGVPLGTFTEGSFAKTNQHQHQQHQQQQQHQHCISVKQTSSRFYGEYSQERQAGRRT